MNCLILLLLLGCNGNWGGDCGSCGNSRIRGGGNDCRDNDGCGNDREDGNCGNDRGGNERGGNERGGSCDRPGPAAWSDCGCDNEPPRMPPPPRTDFPGFNRGETCGCENQNQNSQN